MECTVERGKANLRVLGLIFGFWTNIHVLDKIPGFGTKSLGPWTNPWGLDKTKRFKLRGGNRFKIENLTSLSSVKATQEP